MGTVPKPTQVGGMRILRRSSELALRNSAKYTRNFGISVALFQGRSEMTQATVYQKHRSLRTSNGMYRD